MDLRNHLQDTLGSAFTPDRELGGGMSRVFVATDAALGRQIVVKVLPPDSAGQVSIDRFKREIKLAASLQHPHIVPLLSAGESQGLPFYTMPFVKGESLRERLVKGELSVKDTIHVLHDVATRSPTRTARALSIATSNRRTSFSRAASRSSRISGFRKRSTSRRMM